MPHIVIGHTTETTARIWLRGDAQSDTCEVEVRPPLQDPISPVTLSAGKDYTGVRVLEGLEPGTEYHVRATFSPSSRHVHGRFRTFHAQLPDKTFSFSFVLSSCNLSIVSINGLLSMLLGLAGVSVATSSLKLPLARWRRPRPVWMRFLTRHVASLLLKGGTGLVKVTTDFRQPPPPYLRSPFLKLAAVFESVVLEVLAEEDGLPAVGDRVTSSGAKGILACSPTRVEDGPKNSKQARWRLVLTYVEGSFLRGGTVFSGSGRGTDDDTVAFGTIELASPGQPWYPAPDFFIHAGDQIYYDFPDDRRPPVLEDYRQAYRDAWFEDDANRRLLSRWTHYMTLDDHEIADQFSRDFTPPAPRKEGAVPATADDYLREATTAYDEYVVGRHPLPKCPDGPVTDRIRRWYTFEKGCARFFVLDTRTNRSDGRDKLPPRMIDDEQMDCLLDWMSADRQSLKFIVTSVPFVAEIDEGVSKDLPRWTSGKKVPIESLKPSDKGPGEPRNPASDTWSASRFKSQRDRIIRHICCEGIERVIFLAGDMHCCYHATMRIGSASKYESGLIHELAGGPVNQLQIANISQFHVRHVGWALRDGALEQSGLERQPDQDHIDRFHVRHCGAGTDCVRYEVVLERFHGDLSAVMHVKVNYAYRDEVAGSRRVLTPEIEWNVIRTLTDNGASAWAARDDLPVETRRSPTRARAERVRVAEPVMKGRITFAPRRTVENLSRWPVDAPAALAPTRD